MTYCIAAKLEAGMVFLSDSRTNAGVDAISTFRKMTIFERPNDRVIVMMTAGNLAISQAVRHYLTSRDDGIWQVSDMFDAARLVGDAIRHVYDNDADNLKNFGIDFNVSIILGGQIKGEAMRLFMIYSAGNFIEATDENCFFQIGEAKYGKPILDRVINPHIPLEEATKCALVSMDSTLKSNISVGLPLDLFEYDADSFKVDKFVHITEENPYFNMIKETWGERLKEVFSEIQDPMWQKNPRNIFEINNRGNYYVDTAHTLKVHPPETWF
jgi:putative proteasome-type protease